ncbi:xylose isomerase [Haloferula helveola]|uniref:Xylose isomerase n=1 Tax=Haloferula helveola TaxID=490095 RepID=A0ABN6H7X4_9BACT|nr:xylose isomerase [Haloferula helveola]
MNTPPVSRRGFLAGSALAVAGSTRLASANPTQPPARFRYGLNMSTIRGQKLDAAEEIEIAAKAGYDAVEPWLGTLGQYVGKGGKLADLRKRLEDHGLTVESAIGFAPWIVDDDAKRAEGFEQAKRDMDTIAQLGGIRIAAPPAGAPGDSAIDPMRAAERYRALLELGDEMGVIPQIEMWGGNKSIGRVSTAVFIAMEAGHPKACFLGDVYHTYKGGSDFASLLQLGPQALQTFHMNDYPADPPRESIKDEHRVYPGDGIAPLTEILQGFHQVGASPVLSLELFNRSYWKQPALEVAKTGLAKMKAAVAKAGL